MKWNKGENALRARSHPANSIICESNMPRESSAPKQRKASISQLYAENKADTQISLKEARSHLFSLPFKWLDLRTLL